MMSYLYRPFPVFLAVYLIVVPFPSVARDVSLQQAAYNNALKEMEQAEAVFKADSSAVADTEKLIEQKKKQLAEEQKKAELSKKNYLEAKSRLEKAQAALDQAWK